jgi:hypothetical protein
VRAVLLSGLVELCLASRGHMTLLLLVEASLHIRMFLLESEG